MHDSVMIDHPAPARRRWMAILARAQSHRLQALLSGYGALPNHTIVRGPEVGLVMVRGRIGGGGGPFNLGEMTVTRCTVQTDTGLIGHAYIAGRDETLAELAAVTDALMQDPEHAEPIEQQVILPLEHDQIERKTQRSRKAAATQVQFFAMQTMRT